MVKKIFDRLEKHRFRLNKWLKHNSAGLDFFDWCNFILFILGLVLIVEIWYFYKILIGDLVIAVVLWFTGIVILQYTKETYWLKQVEQKNLKFQKAPFVVVHFADPGHFILKNAGRGPARNIKWKINGDDSLCPQKTIISAGHTGYTTIRHSSYGKFKPYIKVPPYEVEVSYENIDGVKYFTRLKSGIQNDDYEVLEYKEIR